jgi:hypothetical protein
MFPNIRLLMICISTPILHNETLFSRKLFSTTLQNVRTLHKLFTFIARSQYPRLSIRILGLSVTATSVLLRPTISTSTAATTATVIITGTTAGRFTHLEFCCMLPVSMKAMMHWFLPWRTTYFVVDSKQAILKPQARFLVVYMLAQ